MDCRHACPLAGGRNDLYYTRQQTNLPLVPNGDTIFIFKHSLLRIFSCIQTSLKISSRTEAFSASAYEMQSMWKTSPNKAHLPCLSFPNNLFSPSLFLIPRKTQTIFVQWSIYFTCLLHTLFFREIAYQQINPFLLRKGRVGYPVSRAVVFFFSARVTHPSVGFQQSAEGKQTMW